MSPRKSLHTIALVVTQGGDEVNFLGIDNSPPGQFHSEVPEPDIESWGNLKRLWRNVQRLVRSDFIAGVRASLDADREARLQGKEPP